MLIPIREFFPPTFKRRVKLFFNNIEASCGYSFSRTRHSREVVRHVVFVCKGNLCRSVFAEHYLRLLLPDHKIKIESCGLEVDQSGFSPLEAVQVGKEFGVDLSTNRSKAVTACEMQKADLIITMEFRLYLKLKAMFPEMQEKITLIREFAPWPDRLVLNISDPYGLGIKECRHCFRKIQRALDSLKLKLEYENNSPHYVF